MKKFYKLNANRSLKGEGDDWIDVYGEDDSIQWWLCGWRINNGKTVWRGGK